MNSVLGSESRCEVTVESTMKEMSDFTFETRIRRLRRFLRNNNFFSQKYYKTGEGLPNRPQKWPFSTKIQNFKKCQKGLFWPFFALFDQKLTLQGQKSKILKKSTKIFQNFKISKILKKSPKNRKFSKKVKKGKIQKIQKISKNSKKSKNRKISKISKKIEKIKKRKN